MTHGRVAHSGALPASGATPPGARWYALRLRSRADFVTRDLLDAAGVECFLPTYEETTRWTDRIARVTRPLFAGYVFARFDAADSSRILQTRGVVQILGAGLAPVAIEDGVIAALQRAVQFPAPVLPCAYVAGETVTVGKGPFAGVSGVITRTNGTTRIVISIEILHRAVSVEIEAAELEKQL